MFWKRKRSDEELIYADPQSGRPAKKSRQHGQRGLKILAAAAVTTALMVLTASVLTITIQGRGQRYQDALRLLELKQYEQAAAELESLDCPIKAQMQIDVAIDELLANIASYAYDLDAGEVTVRMDFDADTRMVSLTFIDSGVAYDPLAKPDPDVTLAVEQREVGGLGIFLVKKTMDDMTYVRRDGRNELTIRKRI